MTAYVSISNREVITLGQKLGEGGEGTVYEISGRPELIAKIYHAFQRTSERENKLRAMVANPPEDDTRRLSPPHISIAWPVDVLYEQKQFVGYVMPRIHQSPYILVYCIGQQHSGLLPER